ncbi:MAG: hypothetical protein PF485_14595 [Bacteroidales bacterium]|jgi:hypothetical protein|nr:hypothetical protein [Bacteroidales bacterium]
MNCDNFKKWIHLNNPKELSNAEKRKLNDHLSSCTACRKLFEDVESSNKIIQKLKTIEPELTYPQVLTSNIMQSIKVNKKSSRFSFTSIEFFEILFSNKVKILAYFIVIGLIGLFAYQQLFIINKLNQMERQIAIKSDESIVQIKTPVIVNNKLLMQFVSELENEQIVLDRKSLEQLLETFQDLKTDHDDLLELLNNNIKDLEKRLSSKDIILLKKFLKEDDLVKNLSTNL